MSVNRLRRQSYWLLPLLAAALVALGGARLITLSVRERSAQLRTTAESAVQRHGSRIEAELAALIAAARREGADVPNTRGPENRGRFSMSAAGTVQQVAPADAAIAQALAAEWAAAGAHRVNVALFGPVRYGSEWLVAARAALAPPSAEAPGPSAWSVSFENLESLLARARFGTLVSEGYDFQLSQPDPVTHYPRIFLTSQPGTLIEPVTVAIREPGAAATAPFLTLAIRPRTGWYPARELAAEVGLLALLVWAVAFGAYDLTHSLSAPAVRWRSRVGGCAPSMSGCSVRSSSARACSAASSTPAITMASPGCRTAAISWISSIGHCARSVSAGAGASLLR